MLFESIGIVSATVFALIVVNYFGGSLERVYGALSSPLGTAHREARSQADLPILTGLSLNYACYFLSGVTFAVTGGTAGFFASTAAATALPMDAFAGLRDGFLVGVLFAGFARLRAAAASNALTDQLSSLSTITLGL